MQIHRPVSVRAGVKSLFREYCSNSSVHGVQYFGSRDRNLCEKLLWVLVFALSVGSCGWLVMKAYCKWNVSPIIVSFAERSTPIWQVPFPAVTICPEVKVPSSVFNFTREYDVLIGQSSEQQAVNTRKDFVLAMMQICEKPIYPKLLNYSKPFPNKTTTDCYGTIIRKMNFDLDQIFQRCWFFNNRTSCGHLFSPTTTDEGICFSFNALSAADMLRMENLQSTEAYLTERRTAHHWTQDQGYTTESDLSSYPFRILRSGHMTGLKVLLRSEREDHDFLCRGAIRGYKVLLHSNDEYPQVVDQYVRITTDQEVAIAVKPQIITTTPGLHHYTAERRQCFLNHERYLQFFREYNQDNCELECLTNYTLQECGCVKFSMHRTNDTAECDTEQLRCILNAEDRYLEMDFRSQRGEWSSFRSNCNCLPSCASVQYDVEITQTGLDWKGWLNGVNITPTNVSEGTEFSLLWIYFKESQFMTSRRSELYGLTDFLANCGGLLGLCMGVSLLSLVELLYYCLVRPVSLWKEQRRLAEQEDELEGKEHGITLLSIRQIVVE